VSYNPIITRTDRPVLATDAPPATLVRCECGATVAPDGTCHAIGECGFADAAATRHAGRATAKYAIPAAWNVRGGVD
jgi:hypothetical protein